MTVARNAADALDKHVTLEVECIDRMYLNVYQPLLQTSNGVSYFFRRVRGKPVPSSTLMAPMTRSFVSSIESFCQTGGIDLIQFQRGERKDDRALAYLGQHDGSEGVLFVGKIQEKASVFRTQRSIDPVTGQPFPRLVRASAMPNAYYFYLFDDDFGPCFLKFCSYFPYTAKLCINGHEYLKRQLAKRSIPFEALDNGLLSCAQPDIVPDIAAELTAPRIDALLRKWLEILPHPFTAEDRRQGVLYDISVVQAEFSLTQVFDRPLQGRVLFEEIVRENLDMGRPDRVQLLFDRRIIKTTPSRFRTRVITHGVDPSLHFEYKKTRTKQYFLCAVAHRKYYALSPVMRSNGSKPLKHKGDGIANSTSTSNSWVTDQIVCRVDLYKSNIGCVEGNTLKRKREARVQARTRGCDTRCRQSRRVPRHIHNLYGHGAC